MRRNIGKSARISLIDFIFYLVFIGKGRKIIAIDKTNKKTTLSKFYPLAKLFIVVL